jgi:hypothetical protein
MTNDEHRATYPRWKSEHSREQNGRSLGVHRLIPGSEYTVEGCVTLCYQCHAKRTSAHRADFKQIAELMGRLEPAECIVALREFVARRQAEAEKEGGQE